VSLAPLHPARVMRSGALLLPLLLLSACDSQSAQPRANFKQRPQPVELVLVEGRPAPEVLDPNQVLRRGNGEEPRTLDPHRSQGVPTGNILRDLFEGLTTEAADGEIIPGAAIRWNISRDGKEYTFYLHRDLQWSNGDKLTAHDFIFSLRRAADPATASNNANMLLPIAGAAEVISGELPPEKLQVAALDDFSLQIRLVDATPYFLALLSHPIAYPVHQPSLAEWGDQFAREGNLVSNGAYLLQRWEPRAQIVLIRNPYYRAAEFSLMDKVVYLPIDDLNGEVNQFRAGELDWTFEVPNNQFAWLRKNYPDELVVSPWLGSFFFGFNLSREPFIENPGLRRALVLAIDRQVLTEKVTQFGEQPSFALVPPGIGDYQPAVPDYADWTQPERVLEAQRLYQLAGFSADNPLRIEIRYNTSENNKKLALAVASMWKQELGVLTTLVNEEWKVFLQNREQKVLTQVFRAGWISDYNDPYSFLELFRSGEGRNDFAYSNTSFDALLEEMAKERTPARRNRMMYEAERLLLEDNPIVPVYTYVSKRLVDPHVQGWQSNAMDHHYSRYMYQLKSRSPDSDDTSPPLDEMPPPPEDQADDAAGDQANVPGEPN
jgi:oligopeptide transport system substrate-binding protein